MKLKILNIFLISSVFISSISCSPMLRKDFSEHENKAAKISVAYPTNWQQKNDISAPFVLIALSPPDNEQDLFTENINVVSEPAPNYNFESFYTVNIDSMRNGLVDFRIVREGTKNINGRPSKWIIYTHNYEGLHLKVKAYFFHDGKTGFVYTATANASPDTFKRYEQLFDDIAGTIKLK